NEPGVLAQPVGIDVELRLRSLVRDRSRGEQAVFRIAHTEKPESVPANHRQADSSASIVVMRGVPGTVVDVRPVTHVLIALAVNQTALIPFAALAGLQEDEVGNRLAEVNAVGAHQKTEIHATVLNLLSAMPQAIH